LVAGELATEVSSVVDDDVVAELGFGVTGAVAATALLKPAASVAAVLLWRACAITCEALAALELSEAAILMPGADNALVIAGVVVAPLSESPVSSGSVAPGAEAACAEAIAAAAMASGGVVPELGVAVGTLTLMAVAPAGMATATGIGVVVAGVAASWLTVVGSAAELSPLTSSSEIFGDWSFVLADFVAEEGCVVPPPPLALPSSEFGLEGGGPAFGLFE
jgi:hypothetical protein